MFNKLKELSEASQSKFKKGDKVKLNKKFIADLKKEDPSIDFNNTDTAIIESVPTGSKNPGEQWRWKYTLTKPFFGRKSWPEHLLSAATLQEATQYDSSSDFESDVSKVQDLIKQIDTILDKEELNDWIDATETNFSGSNASRNFEKVVKSLDDLKNNFDDFYNQIVVASDQ